MLKNNDRSLGEISRMSNNLSAILHNYKSAIVQGKRMLAGYTQQKKGDLSGIKSSPTKREIFNEKITSLENLRENIQ